MAAIYDKSARRVFDLLYQNRTHDSGALEAELNRLAIGFEKGETEETWLKFEEALQRLMAIALGSSSVPGFASMVKTKLKKALLGSLNSERTRLSRTALLLTDVLAKELKEKFELLAEFLLPAVLKLTARANKVYVTSAHSTLLTCIDATQGLAFLIPLLVESRKSPSKTLRITAGACLVKIADIAPLCKLEPFVEKIEDSIRHNILDSVPEVRELARSLFEVFSLNFEHRVHRFVSTLPDTGKKYLKLDDSRYGQARTAPSTAVKPQRPKVHASVMESADFSRPVMRSAQLQSSPDMPVRTLSMPQTDNAAARRRVFAGNAKPSMAERLLKLKSSLDAADIFGGAMRVPRESVAIAPAVEPMSAFGQDLPLRVPANSQSVESTSSHGSECGEPIPPPPPESTPAPVKKRVFVSEFAKSPKLNVDLSTLQQYSKSHDWAIRNQVFGTLNKVIAAKDFKLSPKITELVSAGLKDPHFRVAQSALSTTEALLDIGVGPESLLASAVIVVYQSTQKTRQPWSELYASTLERLTIMVGDAAPSLLLHVLGDPSLAKKGRARTGLIHCLSLVPQSSLAAFVVKQANFKFFMSRLVMCAFDAASDLGLKEKLCTVIQLLFTLHSEHFWGCWSSLKPAEQKALSGCFGVKDLKNHKDFKETMVKATVAVKRDATPMPSPIKVTGQIDSAVETPSSRIPVMFKTPAPKAYHVSGLPMPCVAHELPDSLGLAKSAEEIVSCHDHTDEVKEEVTIQQQEKAAPQEQEQVLATMIATSQEDLTAFDTNYEEVESTALETSPQAQALHVPAPDVSSQIEIFALALIDSVESTTVEPEDVILDGFCSVLVSETLSALVEELSKEGAVTMEYAQCYGQDYVMREEVEECEAISIPQIAPSAEPVISFQETITPQIASNPKSVSLSMMLSILASLSEKNQSPAKVLHCLYMLRNLVTTEEPADLEQYAEPLMEHVLKCHETDEWTPEQSLEKSYLLDDLLQLAIETFSPPRVFESLTKVFSLNPRWVFGLVKRVLERCSSAVSEDGEEEERVLLGLARENSGLQNHLIEGLGSNRSATRQSAFELFVHLSQRLGPEWNDNIMEQLVKALGVSGSRTLRLMLDGARRSLVVE